MTERILSRYFPLIVFLALFASPARSETIAETADRFAKLTLGESAVTVPETHIIAGHMDATLRRGILAPVFAGKEEVGFYFRGEGSWRYVSAAIEEFASLKWNAGEATHWKPQISSKEAVITDEFKEVLWLSPGKSLAPAGASASPPEASDFARHREYFSRVRYISPSQRAAYASRHSGGRFTWAEFSGGKNDMVYAFDPVLKRFERLFAMKKAELDASSAKPESYLVAVSEQPIGSGFRDNPTPGLLLSRVEADVDADGESAHIVARETFIAIEKPIRFLSLNLESRVVANSFADIRPYKLMKVTSADGKELVFDHRQGNVLVELPEEQAVDKPFTLRFEMEGKVLYRPDSDSYWMLGFEPWYAQPDLGAAAFTWKCRVKVKKPFVPIASGTVVGRKEEGDWNILTVEIDKPVILPVVLAGKYHLEEIKKDGRTIRVASYAFTNKRAAEHLSTLASQIIKFYEPFLGPFPWSELTIIEVNSYGFGVAPPGTMLITREAFSQHEDDLTKLFSQGLNERFAHEIAHQWWGHQVKWPRDEEEWLSESFAEYCAALLIRAQKGDGAYRSLVAQFESQSKESSKYASLATANRLEGEGSFRHRTNVLYGKGPWLLAVLHKQMGEQGFLTFLKTYQTNLKWKFCSTNLVQMLAEFITKKPYADFFDRYYWGTETPAAPR